MAYRFTARSTTPGEYRLASGVLGQLIALGDIQEGVNRGDGGIGTFAVPDEDEVDAGVGFGAGGTEFEGSSSGGTNITHVNGEPVELGTIGVLGLRRVT